MSKVEQYTQNAINIANDNSHGYSQYNRWGSPDYDCSALVITVVENSGIPVKTNGATYTGNMLNPFLKSGFKDITNQINLRTGYGLKRGDILLNIDNHTEIYTGNNRVVGASISENGTIHGRAGDQTGREIRVTNYYNYPWDRVLRYPETYTHTNNTINSAIKEFAKEVIKGNYGNGQARKEKIYNTVQGEVNNILNNKPLKNNYVTTLAREVIKGNYGNGQARKEKLYTTIQKQVNKML